MDRFTSDDLTSTTRAPSSEAVGLANAVVLAAVFWAAVAVAVWCVFT